MDQLQIMEETFFDKLKDVAKQYEENHLTLPKLNEAYLSIKFDNELGFPDTTVARKGPLPFSDSEVVSARLINSRRLTKEDPGVKKTLELTIEFCDEQISYQPGDSFGFLCRNCETEVNELLTRLRLSELADVPFEIKVKEEFKHKKKIPTHIPLFSTMKNIFTSCMDIRAAPKKVFLRVLSTYCDDHIEQQSLQFLSSREGSHYYTTLIVEQMLSLLDILTAFPSCCPPVQSLIEHLPALKPRFYSVVSSPLASSFTFQVAFNVIEIEKSGGRCSDRKGVCTGWLEKLSLDLAHSKNVHRNEETTVNGLANGISRLTLEAAVEESLPCISVYKRRNDHFLLPEDLKTPVILVGPGTGVAPFIGFLRHREYQIKECGCDTEIGEMWLIYGCRYKEKDFLYREELCRFTECKVLSNLLTCFSRDETSSNEHLPRYVQDVIKLHAMQLVKLIDSGAVVYVCGDARNMAKNVRCSFIEIIKEFKKYSDNEAEDFMKNLEKEHRFCLDVWV